MKEELIDINSTDKKVPYEAATLVLGICSIIGSFIYGIPGIICGIIALSISKRGMSIMETESNGKSLQNLKAGRICAIIGLVLSTLMTALYVMIIIYVINHRASFVR